MKSSKRLGCILLAYLMLCGCVTSSRGSYELGRYQSAVTLNPLGFDGVRFDATDPVATANFRSKPKNEDNNMRVLALSGGGARGAFAAGVLRGWTQSGTRPAFDLVTGVSVGALAAPFAFLGSAFDDSLEQAFTGEEVSGLLRQPSTGFRALFGNSFAGSEPLRALTERYVTPAIIEAVAQEHNKGRRLLVATTNLDSQRTVIWDMGAIATKGGPDARKLFIDILIASASIPGILPPVMFDVENSNRQRFQEMHVDGGVNVPFLAIPEAMQFEMIPEQELQRGHIWVIINGRIAPDAATTKSNTLAILSGSFDSMQRASSRITLATTEEFCRRNGLGFTAISLPQTDQASNDSLNFNPQSMARLYAIGAQIGRDLR
jgi:Patatin-like phospholipase